MFPKAYIFTKASHVEILEHFSSSICMSFETRMLFGEKNNADVPRMTNLLRFIETNNQCNFVIKINAYDKYELLLAMLRFDIGKVMLIQTDEHYELAKHMQSAIQKLDCCTKSTHDFAKPYKSAYSCLTSLNLPNLTDAVAEDIGTLNSFINLHLRTNIETIVREQFTAALLMDDTQ